MARPAIRTRMRGELAEAGLGRRKSLVADELDEPHCLDVIRTPVPCLYISPGLYSPQASAWSAARRCHRAVSVWSSGTPMPYLYISPRLHYPTESPWSAVSRCNRTASVWSGPPCHACTSPRDSAAPGGYPGRHESVPPGRLGVVRTPMPTAYVAPRLYCATGTQPGGLATSRRSRSTLTAAETRNGARQVGQFLIWPPDSAHVAVAAGAAGPHRKHCPYVYLPWSSSFSRQIGHGCAGSPSLPATPAAAATAAARDDAGAGADDAAAASAGIGAGLQWVLWLPPHAASAAFGTCDRSNTPRHSRRIACDPVPAAARAGGPGSIQDSVRTAGYACGYDGIRYGRFLARKWGLYCQTRGKSIFSTQCFNGFLGRIC